VVSYGAGHLRHENPGQVSVRLYDQGYMFKDLYGQLRLTDKGKTLLRSL